MAERPDQNVGLWLRDKTGKVAAMSRRSPTAPPMCAAPRGGDVLLLDALFEIDTRAPRLQDRAEIWRTSPSATLPELGSAPGSGSPPDLHTLKTQPRLVALPERRAVTRPVGIATDGMDLLLRFTARLRVRRA